MILRKAKITDVEPIHTLITYYADRGLMLARSRNMLYENLREFIIAEDRGRVIAAGSLHITWKDLAEIRALAIAPEYTKKSIGRNLVGKFIEEARELGVPRIFALTYQNGFFAKCGFRIVEKDSLPQKVWKECVNCPKFPNCEEIAMIVDVN